MTGGEEELWHWTGVGALMAAAALSAILIILLRPLLQRYALARPNARSSHRVPTPQGGGVAVIAATVIVTIAGVGLQGELGSSGEVVTVLAAAVFMAAVGVVDDLRPLPVPTRLLLQALAVAVVIAVIPSEVRIVPALPAWAERLGLFIGLAWLVNLVNFMDGIDWMTVAEVVPLTTTIVLLAQMGVVPLPATTLSLALLGATLGFAPFNKPVAKLFLGDVGSLPIGLLLGWLLLQLGRNAEPAAALLLPLYYLADASVTLLRRIVAHEPFWQAHRSHFYQRACDMGFSVRAIVTRVFLTNVALAGLALITVAKHDPVALALSLAAGAALVACLLVSFSRKKR
jgi:UDP-N-acetylmuramyl pentapeptide phosphotransferase/UDP-N-acetylglucosamine-1-phosphate transferase